MTQVRAKQQRRATTQCMFCERDATRRGEHLFSNWMAEYIDFRPPNHTASVLRGASGLKVEVGLKGGPLHTLRVPHVCATCNNGWMSRLEMQAKPALVSLMQHKEISLNKQDQTDIAKWAALKTMVGEFLNPSTVTIWRKTREAFALDQQVPGMMRIWIASTNSPRTEFRHHCAAIYPKVLSGADLPQNSQLSTFMFQGLILQTGSSYGTNQIGLSSAQVKLLRQLYPAPNRLKWPLTKGIAHQTIDAFLDDRNFENRIDGKR